jgi:hypothetical protein
MLSQEEYTFLSKHLNDICRIVPYKWGRMQTKDLDRRLPKLLEYKNYDELNGAIQRNVTRGILPDNDEENNYYRHRWFLYKCAEVDEYLFGNLPNITAAGQANPWYDFTVYNRYNLDLKGTVILKQYKDDPEYVFKNPLSLINSFYREQSNDFYYRHRNQNRLFLVHHSFITPANEPYLRVQFGVKSKIFEEYAKMLMNPNHEIYGYLYNRKTDVIFLLQNIDLTFSYGFGSENLKGELIIHPYSELFNVDNNIPTTNSNE